MAWLEPAPITERVVLRVLVAGFALVVGLLGPAGFVAVPGTRAIEDDTAEIGRAQLAMTRILNDIQAGQNTLAAILHQLAPGQSHVNRKVLLRQLDDADRALAKLAISASGTPEAARWVDSKPQSRNSRGACELPSTVPIR
jgi:hypothetical protein